MSVRDLIKRFESTPTPKPTRQQPPPPKPMQQQQQQQPPPPKPTPKPMQQQQRPQQNVLRNTFVHENREKSLSTQQKLPNSFGSVKRVQPPPPNRTVGRGTTALKASGNPNGGKKDCIHYQHGKCTNGGSCKFSHSCEQFQLCPYREKCFLVKSKRGCPFQRSVQPPPLNQNVER